MQTWVLRSPANIWVPLRCHPLFGDVNQRKGGKRKNLSQTCKHKLAETVFNSISYSEKAFAYKLKNDVLKRKSGRKKSQVDHKTPRKRAIEIISEDCGDSPKQVQRYISLTKLIPEMLQKLDDEIISFCPAVEIAALSEKEQKELLVAMEYAQAIPSLSQAQRIRQMSKEKQLSLEKMEEIMCEVKKGEITRVAFTNEQLHKYFPNSYTPAMMKREILALLKLWKKESWES